MKPKGEVRVQRPEPRGGNQNHGNEKRDSPDKRQRENLPKGQKQENPTT